MIEKQRRLHFWCQKVLPLVYDDSLSYYELLNKVVHYLNDNTEAINQLIDFYDSISQDIQDIITEMLEDGRLEDIVVDAIAGVIAEEYDPTKSYNPLNYVIYNGDLYRCKEATTGVWDSTKWRKTNVGNELNNFHVLPQSYGSTVPETYLNELLTDITDAGLYFGRRDYATGATTGYFGTSSINMILFTGASKNYVSGIVFSDNQKQFISFRKYEDTYNEYHYIDEINDLNNKITQISETHNFYDPLAPFECVNVNMQPRAAYAVYENGEIMVTENYTDYGSALLYYSYNIKAGTYEIKGRITRDGTTADTTKPLMLRVGLTGTTTKDVALTISDDSDVPVDPTSTYGWFKYTFTTTVDQPFCFLIMPKNAAWCPCTIDYLTITALTAYDQVARNSLETLKHGFTKLDGKEIRIYGDSISDETFTPSGFIAQPNWVTYLRRSLTTDTKIFNNSVAGTSITGQLGVSQRILTDATQPNFNPDIIIIFAGINDFRNGRPLGAYNSTADYTTLWGSMRKIYNTVSHYATDAQVFVVSPLKEYAFESYPDENDPAKPVSMYRSVMQAASKWFGFMFIDGYSAPMLNPYFTEVTQIYQPDKIHPSTAYAPILCDYIASNINGYNSMNLGEETNVISLADYASDGITVSSINAYFKQATGELTIVGSVSYERSNAAKVDIIDALPAHLRPRHYVTTTPYGTLSGTDMTARVFVNTDGELALSFLASPAGSTGTGNIIFEVSYKPIFSMILSNVSI